jgi:hypothetical protein
MFSKLRWFNRRLLKPPARLSLGCEEKRLADRDER